MNTEKTPFIDLLDGDKPFVRIMITTEMTNATRPPMVGIWHMDRDTFVRIAEHISKYTLASRFLGEVGLIKGSPVEDIAEACDSGTGQRFFRLNAEFARWLDATDPEYVIEIDCVVT